MKRFKVVIEVTNFETYHVNAVDADEAQQKVLSGEAAPISTQYADILINQTTEMEG